MVFSKNGILSLAFAQYLTNGFTEIATCNGVRYIHSSSSPVTNPIEYKLFVVTSKIESTTAYSV